MNEHDWLAERFEAERSHLRAVAFRMLGSLSEADDAVQESWLRLSRSGASGVENLGGWLTTIVARVCLNMLRSRNSRREELLDARAPGFTYIDSAATDPEHEAVIADSVGLALLVVLETLSPAERTRLRPSRHVRRPLRRDRAHRWTDPGGGTPAREPSAPAGARIHGGAKCGPRPPAQGRGRIHRSLTKR